MTAPSRLVVLTDRSQLPLGRSLLATVRECLDAGASTILVRELDLPLAQRAALCAAVADLGATVVSARVRLPDAHGVHLAADQEPDPGPLRPDDTRASGRSEPGAGLHGRSCHTRAEVRRAAAEGAAYATLSPFAATTSKPGHGPPLAAGGLAGHPIPVLALGGITPVNAARAREAGAHGVAVMGAVMRADHPGDVVRALLAAIS